MSDLAPSLEGSAPPIADAEALARVIDEAFDYRGDVTILTADGREFVGYVYNRNREVTDPFLQLFPAGGGPPLRLGYRQVQRVVFTGRDTAAGNSYAAWLKRKDAERSGAPAPGA